MFFILQIDTLELNKLWIDHSLFSGLMKMHRVEHSTNVCNLFSLNNIFYDSAIGQGIHGN